MTRIRAYAAFGVLVASLAATTVASAQQTDEPPTDAPTEETPPGEPNEAAQAAEPVQADEAAQAAEPAVPAEGAAPVQADAPPLHQPVTPGSAFEGAPRPGPQAARNAVAGVDSPSPLLWIPRAIFFVPRWALEAAFVPLRGLAWVYDRYNLAARFRLVFFNDAQTFGVFPVAFFETGFGLNAGARMVHRDLFGGGERLTVRAGAGGRFQQLYQLQFDSGTSLGNNGIDFTVEWEARPRDRFFGIGSAEETRLSDVGAGDLLNTGLDESTPFPPFGPNGIDPLTDSTSVETRFSQDIFRAELGVRRNFGPFQTRVSGTYRYRNFGEPDFNGRQQNAAIGQVYDTTKLIGLAPGSSLSNLYVEFDVSRDTRRSRRRSVWQPGEGYRAELFAGYTLGFGDDPSDYVRYGADLSYLLPLYGGDRTLVLRGYVEGVTAARDEIPFTDLPRLGGPVLLRGYDRDRFRDRLAAMASLEYEYPLARNALAFIFTDIGRVSDGWDDFEIDDLDYTFGIGLQTHSQTAPQFRLHLAGSLDGDVLLALSFDPVFVTRPRSQRD